MLYSDWRLAPWMVLTSMSAPASRSSSSTVRWLFLAASCRAVNPSLSLIQCPARASRRNLTNSLCPLVEAKCSAVQPSSSCREVSALFSTRYLATSTLPANAEQCRGHHRWGGWPRSLTSMFFVSINCRIFSMSPLAQASWRGYSLSSSVRLLDERGGVGGDSLGEDMFTADKGGVGASFGEEEALSSEETVKDRKRSSTDTRGYFELPGKASDAGDCVVSDLSRWTSPGSVS
mmetsp:Transcript_28650/g.64919  ORF Transcript_28650/g.64919 Transcript_28650/m.64919 type:complete len:233 (-) Transcript_28650:193-891(-)